MKEAEKASHTPDPWPEFDELVARDKELTEGVYVALNREQYDYARIRIQACAGIPTEKLSAIAVQLLLAEEQRDELLSEINHHHHEGCSSYNAIDPVCDCWVKEVIDNAMGQQP